MSTFHIATFAADVTPPLGHPLCGGWIEPVRGVEDPLKALGVVLLGGGAPVVLCAVDWCELRNSANTQWAKALAEAAHTTPDRAIVHCVHQHDAPMADVEAQRLIEKVPGATANLDLKFFDRVVKQCAEAVKASLTKTRSFTHIGVGQAKVEQVASNRRILGPDGTVRYTRTSFTQDPKVRAEPEGLIDPWLKCLSFWNGETPIAALYYYATHPMAHYGAGLVSSDFCGLARLKRSQEEPNVHQVYFTGCAGNITAGKYNEAAKKSRSVLRDRVHAGMVAAWKATKRHEVKDWQWRIEPIKFSPRREPRFTELESRKVLHDEKASNAARGNSALHLGWLERIDRPIPLTCLDFGPALIAHLPGEPFIEYQLKAQEIRPDAFVCVAGYGDGGTGYIPTDKGYMEGGYEPTVALAAPAEALLSAKMAKLLRAGK